MTAQTQDATAPHKRPPLAVSLFRLIRPQQWAKSVFVLIGPLYGLADLMTGPSAMPLREIALRALTAAAAFAFASSACYIVNDMLDAEQDRAHPRKRSRPIASGAVSVPVAGAVAILLVAGAAGMLMLLPPSSVRGLVGLAIIAYVVNVTLYSIALKHIVIADVMSLALGFVLRVLGGCAAVGVSPTVWLLNCTFFLAMFLAFGKRLGERRAMGARAQATRRVHDAYTDTFLVMAVVVTGVATLLGYTIYVADQHQMYEQGFNLLWLTVLPATYALFRCIVLLVDRGGFDDPTELAIHDRAFQVAALLFAAMTGALYWWFRLAGP